jgi:Fe-S cluster assembly protein SufD
VGAGTRRLLVETLEASAGVAARALDVAVGEGGELTRIVLQGGGDVVLSRAAVTLAAGAQFRQFVLAEGARLARIETDVVAAGAGARIELSGVYLAGPGRHADLTSGVRLAAPSAEVRQLVKGAARAGGRGVFQGKFRVDRAAQLTDARMRHSALLLEAAAEAFAKPELEIYADNVQCAHGSTSGQLDADALFYLRQRGLPEPAARALLTRAFLAEALPDWLPEPQRAEVEARIDRWLAGAAA